MTCPRSHGQLGGTAGVHAPEPVRLPTESSLRDLVTRQHSPRGGSQRSETHQHSDERAHSVRQTRGQ